MQVTLEQVADLGAKHAAEAYNESQSTQTPDGGWDSWLINGIGDGVYALFGEPIEESVGGWSDAMASKLHVYHEAAEATMTGLEDAAEATGEQS